MRLIDADNYIGKVIASHCYSGVNKVIRIDDVPTVDVNNLLIAELEKIKHEIGKEFVDLQDGSEEWRSYVNDAVLSCYEIVENRIHELKGSAE